MNKNNPYGHDIVMFDVLAGEIARQFFVYMYSNDEYTEKECDEDFEDFYFIGDDPFDTMEMNDYYWSMSTMYEVIKNEYPKDKVWAWYHYITDYCDYGQEKNYYLNLKHFVYKYDGTDLEEWALKYRLERDDNTKFWNSPKGKEQTKIDMETLKDDFIKKLGK